MAIINNLNGDKVEFTGVSRFWNNTKYDFEEIYFGDKQIFSIWAELESPLPITILAAGEDLIDYRIYGNTENGESVGERTENLLDENAPDYENLCFYDQNNTFYANNSYAESGYIPVKAGTTYSIVVMVQASGRVLIANFFDTNKNFVSNLLNRIGPVGVYTLTIPSDGYVRFNICLGKSWVNSFMFIEGSTAPTSYIPYGYKLPMVVRSRNLFSENMIDPQDNVYINANGQISWIVGCSWKCTGFVHVVQNSMYTFDPHSTSGAYATHCFYDKNYTFISAIGSGKQTFTTPSGCEYMRFSFRNTSYDITLVEGSTVPTSYIPYYRDEENVYIGSDPLAEDEYVDFGAQKVYRMEGGTLTPTDPPVPIPALPTIQGETIIDYNPSTTPAVEPEKMYTKYRKEGF